MNTKKTYLGSHRSFSGRERVYEVEDALQVDSSVVTEVQRYRVFFDDVLMITYHRYKGTAFLAITGLLALLGTLGSIGLAALEPVAGLIVFVLLVAPFILLFVLRATMGVDSVTVYGRRSQARMSFWFGKERGREVYRQLADRIRRHQEKSAPPPPPPPASDPTAPPPPLPPLAPPA